MYRSLFIALLISGAPVLAADPAAVSDAQRLQELEIRVKQLESEQDARASNKTKQRQVSSNFNPAISLILNGKFSAFSRDPSDYALPGFALGEEANPGKEGFRLAETELVMSAAIDDKFHGMFIAALTPENKVEVEEAFIETLALGHGATLKAGRFFSHIGYLNAVHAHAWDFVDQPLVYRAMLGNQYGDDGAQLRWVAPSDVFFEIGTELFRGASFPAGGAADSGKGTTAAFVHVGGDVGTSHAWRLGLSRLDADSANRATGEENSSDRFTGNSELTGIDFIWKWAPEGNPRHTNVKFQTEYFQRKESGTFTPSSGSAAAYQGKQKGWYAQVVYQFVPRWRAGLRVDRLRADPVNTALAGTVLDNQGHRPQRTSAMLDFSHSEFSRLRLQVNQDESRANKNDTQWYVQYIMSLGAHGAHAF